MKSILPKNIDEYIAGFPENVQERLTLMRSTLKKAIPGAEEAIKYAMPTMMVNGRNLVHFAAFKNHIGFYALPVTHEAFAKELSKYTTGKGSVQFPLDQQLPVSLITKMTKFRLKNAMEKAALLPRKTTRK
ncbi:iron chaperone [Chitinophaga arvensicola]|uniref:Uncharacterized conserved protein YdhG, YjbR/CyaY-like superfamily, DUF1801 family n=1 Tax=Chitinophaga arvensicola TaxID=29529 RepID=A0A1I0S8B7_9BACT|nr:DUF1801 domain-containing protein [Chitinophaga arvensicola]SEW52157.1 Uncharacterized conserved protein YdhG, YjbR/CyaY-like superfamily, DUF1801 family [Chitinophaga arvensicola]